jgi:putative hemolysin
MDIQIIELIIFIFLIFLTGFLAAAEIAISSFGENKIEEMKERKETIALSFEKIQKDPEIFFGTIQTLTTICLIASAMLVFHFASTLIKPLFENSVVGNLNPYSNLLALFSALMLDSFLILIFGLLIPKALGFKYSESIGKITVKPLLLLTILFKYPVRIVSSLSNIFLIPFKEKTNFSQTRLSEDELRIIISESVKSGAINETEHEIIENIFEFNELRANEVMIPRTEMTGIDINDQRDLIIDKIIKSGHTLFPVYEDSADNIIGVLHIKDLMKSIVENQKADLKSLVRPAYFIPDSKIISDVLKDMQKQGERLAIVTDEYGGTEGVITIEDILEELVGELKDKTKVELKEYTKLPDGKFIVLGSTFIDEFNKIFNHDLPESEEYNTVAGFIADRTGKILNAGETFTYNEITFELIKKIRQKMVQFKVYSKVDEFSLSNSQKKLQRP